MTDAANRKLDVKNTGLDDIARDDPLYELSQIIGFSRPSEAEHPQSEPEEQIDLEQELLQELQNYPGFDSHSEETPESQEFSDPDPVAYAPAVNHAERAEPADFDTEFVRDFGGVFDAPEVEDVEPEAPEPVVVMNETDAMEAELYQPEYATEPAPRPSVAEEEPELIPEPEPEAESEPTPDSLEDELLSLLGSIGEKAGATWVAERAASREIVVDEPPVQEQPAFETYVESADADELEPEVVAETPVSAPRPFWFEHNDEAVEPEVDAEPEGEPDEDAALLDAFESELSEGLSISLDEMSQEATTANESSQADISIEDELDLDRAYEARPDIDETAALDGIRSVADEIAAEARPAMPPALETAEIYGDDVETMQPLDLPEPPAEETRRPPVHGIERELDVALSGYDQYDDGEPEGDEPYRETAAAMPAASYDLDAIEDDLARDMEYVSHDLRARTDEDEFDSFEDEIAAPVVAPPVVEKARPGRGMMIAAVVGGVAILGAVGTFALMGGDAGNDSGPVLVRADSEPVKVVPDDPGGKQVPNQDRAVYGEVDGNGETAPTQETLVSTSEEPIDLTGAGSLLPTGVTETAKVEDRLMPQIGASDANSGAQEDTQALLPPRRVRTVIVKPDGTFVPTPAPQAPVVTTVQPPAAPQIADADTPASPALPQEIAGSPEPAQSVTAAETEVLQEMAAVAEPEAAAVQTQNAPTAARSLPTPTTIPDRPVDQPAQIARTQPAPQPQQAATPSGYVVQISSQPSAALAQQSATDLSRRFSDVLGGRAISIQQADIEGRGTFHRVRVAASDRQDAIALCEALKRAGGSCFVAR